MREQRHARPGWQAEGRAQQQTAPGAGALSHSRVALPRPVYNGRGQTVGTIQGDPDGSIWLVKSGLDPAVHRLRHPEGWATETAHLDALRAAGGGGVRLHLVDGTTLEAPTRLWEAHGIQVDRGHGRQVVLPARWWTVHRPGVRQLALEL